jgi:lipopolysaccharide transport system ATP-binding protein
LTDIAIRVEGVSKSYRIGEKIERYRTLRDQIASAAAAPLRLARTLTRHRTALPELFWALKDISFEIRKGEVVGIIGRNGSGKSTLLKVLSRITEPTEGRALVHGRIGSLLEVGTGFHPELSGRENIYLNGAILGMKRREIDRKFDEIVEFANVEQFIDTPVKHYSSGMYLRLAFSVAAHLEPEILLVDEVLAVGDAAFQKKCLGKMSEVAGEGRTVLFVSHNMGAISMLTEQCLWLDQGVLRMQSYTVETIRQYLNVFTTDENGSGFADLSNLPRTLETHPLRFKWARLSDKDNQQSSTFIETTPIKIELGFDIFETTRDLQLGCSVIDEETQQCLYTAASPLFNAEFPAGEYRTELDLDPNYLRAGGYMLVFKAFAQGTRSDHLSPAMRFTLMPDPDNPINGGKFRWIAGPLHFPYVWYAPSTITPSLDGQPIGK